MRTRHAAVLLAVAAALVSPGSSAAAPAVKLQRTPERLTLVTPAYRLVLSAKTGAVFDLVDRRAGADLLRASPGCFWAAELASGGTARGCQFAPGGARGFSYVWNARATTLTLRWQGAAAEVAAEATLVPRDDAIDMRLVLRNRADGTIDKVRFPVELAPPVADVEAGYAPHVLPGTRLRPSFFTGERTATFTYPSRWAFADWLALDVDGGHLALSSVNPAPAPIAPVEIGFVHPNTGPCSGKGFCVVHAFRTWIRRDTTWTSPLVRLRVGVPVEKAIVGYREDNGLDRLPSLADKLDSRLGPLSRAPLVKADLWKGLSPFRDWGPDVARLPSPALLHPVAFQPRGHDEGFPDFLPPDPIWGTTGDFRAALESARSRDVLSMPYLNVSWWDDESRTLADGPDPAKVSVLDASGKPLYETFNDHGGYLVSPWAPFVRERVAALFEQWRTEVPVDCLFLDQIGARPWQRDFNPASPRPEAYADGWLALLQPYASRCLMVEDGWDRLAGPFVGFHASLLLSQRQEQLPDLYFGAATWDPYPLALWLFHDKVLLYQHDLYEGSLTRDLEALRFNLVYGYMLSYAWDGWDDWLTSPWLRVVGDFQRAVGPRFAGKPLTSFREPEPGVTETVFDGLTVVGNGTRAVREVDGYDVAAGGVLARSADGAVVAGVFAGAFAGRPLSPGTHYLVVERDGAGVTVRQPLGPDTDVEVAGVGASPRAHVVDAEGRLGREVALELRDGRAVLRYGARVDGVAVAGYRIDV